MQHDTLMVEREGWFSRNSTVFLLLIVIAATLLRFWHLHETGIFSVDEGRYILDGQSKYYEFEVWRGALIGKYNEIMHHEEFYLSTYLPSAERLLRRRTPFLPKVLNSIAIAAVLWVYDFRAWAGNVVEAVFGVLTVYMTWLLARRLLGKPAALIASVLLAVSCFHLYFSRNSYPQCMSGFFLVLAVWFHHRWFSAWREGYRAYTGLILCGISIGLCFAANYQAGGALPLFILLHLATCLSERRMLSVLRCFVVGGFALAFGFFGIILLLEISTYPMILMFRIEGIDFPHQTFLELLMPRVMMHTSVQTNWEGAVQFPYYLCLFEGWTVLVWIPLFLLGLWGWFTHRKSTPETDTLQRPLYWSGIYLLIAFWVPWAVFSLKSQQCARSFIYILPFFVCFLGWCACYACYLPGRIRVPGRVFTIIMVLVSISGSLWNAREVLAIRSAYPEVMRWLADTPEQGAVTDWSAVLSVYLEEAGLKGGSIAKFAPGHWPPYFISDFQQLYMEVYPDDCIAVPSDSTPIAVFEHQFGRIFLEAELFPAYAPTLSGIQWLKKLDLERARKVYVYDLRKTGLRHPDDKPRRTDMLWKMYPGG